MPKYYVEVQRDKPYVESLYCDYDDVCEARHYAQGQANLAGVKQALVWTSNDELVDTFTGDTDETKCEG